MFKRLAECKDWVKLADLHEDDADVVHEIRIKNINRAHFGPDGEEEFKRYFAQHLENHMYGVGPSSHVLFGRWRLRLLMRLP